MKNPSRHLLKTTESVRIGNFVHVGTLYPIFENYSNDFEYTTNGVFQRIVPPNCLECEYHTNHNGYNECCKKDLVALRWEDMYSLFAREHSKNLADSGNN